MDKESIEINWPEELDFESINIREDFCKEHKIEVVLPEPLTYEFLEDLEEGNLLSGIKISLLEDQNNLKD